MAKKLSQFSIHHDNMGVVTGNNWCNSKRINSVYKSQIFDCRHILLWQTFSWKPAASAWLSLEEMVRSSSVNTRLGSWKLPLKYTGTLNNEGSKSSSGSLWIAAQRENWVKTGEVTAVWNRSIVWSLAFHCCTQSVRCHKWNLTSLSWWNLTWAHSHRNYNHNNDERNDEGDDHPYCDFALRILGLIDDLIQLSFYPEHKALKTKQKIALSRHVYSPYRFKFDI